MVFSAILAPDYKMYGSESYKFPKENRLLKQKDFDRVYRKGKSYNNQNFRFYFLEKTSPPARLGLVVGKEVGKATERNKTKRVIKETFRTNKKLFGHMDIIIRPSSKIGKLEKKQIKKILLKSLTQICERR